MTTQTHDTIRINGQGAKAGDVVVDGRGREAILQQGADGILTAAFPRSKAEPMTILAKQEKSQSDKDGDLMGYLRANIAKPAFAVARRQGFKRVLGIVSDLTWDVAKIKQQAAELIRERDGYKALATAIYGSATGRFTAEQINGHALLSDKQKKDCLDLIAQHRIAVQVRAEEPPAYDEPFFDQIAMELGEQAQRDLTANSDIHDNNRIG